jgi:hypothetical protein
VATGSYRMQRHRQRGTQSDWGRGPASTTERRHDHFLAHVCIPVFLCIRALARTERANAKSSKAETTTRSADAA